MSDYERIEKAAAAREARDAAGSPGVRTSHAGVVDAALLRYLAAREYREHVGEEREPEESVPGAHSEQAPRTSR